MNGVLVLDKPAGPTSHDIVNRVRRVLHIRRVGHTGTLDPFATGVLVLLIGQATRLAQFLVKDHKEYEAVIRLGYATETGDPTGSPIPETRVAIDKHGAARWTRSDIEGALEQLRGEIYQVPPMYSAKKKMGRRLYELARRGEEIERAPVLITIESFDLVNPEGPVLKDNHDGTFDVAVHVACSAGVYIRDLAVSFGEKLGIGAHLVELRRVRSGNFSLANARTLEELNQAVGEQSLGSVMLPLEAALPSLPFLHLSYEDSRRARNGMAIRAGAGSVTWADGDDVKLLDERGSLIAVGRYNAKEMALKPRVVLSKG